MGWTNKGKMRAWEAFFRDGVQCRAVLLTDALDLSDPAVLADINTMSQLTEIPAGNGYSAGGILLTRNSTDFPTVTEDDSQNLAKVTMRDLSWPASGGPIPVSGTGAAFLACVDNNVTPGSREALFVLDIRDGSQTLRNVSDGQPLTIGDTAGGNPITLTLGDPAA